MSDGTIDLTQSTQTGLAVLHSADARLRASPRSRSARGVTHV